MNYTPLIFDIILLFIISGFFFYGFFFGFFRTLGSIVGFFIGAIFASIYFDEAASWIAPVIGDRESIAKVLGFLAVFFVVNQVTGWIFYLLDKLVHLMRFIPFLKTFNRLLGATLGIVEGSLIVGLVLYVIQIFAGMTFVGGWIEQSLVAKVLLPFVDVVVPYFPEIIEKVQTFTHNS